MEKGKMRKLIPFLLLAILIIGALYTKIGLPPAMASSENGKFNPFTLPPIDWAQYHNYSEIVTILLAINQTYPSIVDVFSIGKSWWNRDIYCVCLTNEAVSKPKPEVFFVGYHHAREPITAELALYFVVYMATNFGINQTITNFLNKCKIYVVVALNVDGFDLFKANDYHRKNARPTDEDSDGRIDEDPIEDENGDGFTEQLVDISDPNNPSFIRWEGIDNDGDGQYGEDWTGGVDLNRNYAYKWELGASTPRSEIYRGPAPFSEPETAAIRDFVLAHNLTYAMSLHSGTEEILYPWGWTRTPPVDEGRFVEIAKKLSSVTGGTHYEQSSFMYYTYGEWTDWMYEAAKVFPFTCEIFGNGTWPGVVSPGPYPNTEWEGIGFKYAFNPFPNRIQTVTARWLPALLYLVNRTISDTFHNIGVDSIIALKTIVGEGYTMRLNVSLRNTGYHTETVNLEAYANDTFAASKLFTILHESSATATITWNTSGFAKGNYRMTVVAEAVPYETNISDNSCLGGMVFITIAGDVDGNRKVDGKDVALAAKYYNSFEGQPRYIANVDINDDRRIDGKDFAILAKNYGKSAT
jgi:hypothetical protein